MPIKSSNSNADIQNRYKKLDEIDHVLARPGMYVGSIKNELKDFFLYDPDEGKLTTCETEYCPALLKLVDEVISNSCDEYRRKTNMGLTEVEVSIDSNGTFVCRDNGGIPVVLHKEENMYIPAMIFSQLRTSSNYDDSDARTGIGLNGLGAKLSAIFTTEFIVETADRKKSFKESWSNNLRTPNNDQEIKSSKEHYTRLTYKFDLSRFDGIDCLSDEFAAIVEKRCIDAAAANNGLRVVFRHLTDGTEKRMSEWKFDSFEDYISMYSEYIETSELLKTSADNYEIFFCPSGSLSIGFVNGASCDKGTHIRCTQNAINESVAAFIKSKKKTEIVAKDVQGKYSVFCNFTVVNPSYDSQTKENLVTPESRFLGDNETFKLELQKQFTDKICKSDVIDYVLDYLKTKMNAEEQKALRKTQKDNERRRLDPDKYVACASSGEGCELYLFEGLSAGSAFRVARADARHQAAFCMRGLGLNCLDVKATKAMANAEINQIVQIIGLKFNEYNKKENLRFDKIIITTDADYDGAHISSLLLVMFNTYFPELFDQHMVYRCLSPIIIATKGKERKKFYTMKEYEAEKANLSGYTFKYFKGLGGQSLEDYKYMLGPNKKLELFQKDSNANLSIHKWFGKKTSKDRKDAVKDEV